MIKNSLKDISNIVLLRSDKVLHELLNLKTLNDTQSKAYEYGVRDFYPNSYRKGTMDSSIKYTMNQNQASEFSLDYDFYFLENLFDEYLKFDGNNIYARKEVLDKYSSLINKIHPFNLIGHKLAKKLIEKEVSAKNLIEYSKYITPLALNVNREYKEYAENHIHLGGSNTESLNFISLLTKKTKKEFYEYEKLNILPRINEFSYINNGLYSIGKLIDIAKYCMSIINSCLLEWKINDNFYNDLLTLSKQGRLSLIDVNFCSISSIGKVKQTISNELLKEAYEYLESGYDNKFWFVYNILIFKLHIEINDNQVRNIIKIFLHISNILRSYMLMSQNVGLSHFSEFSSSNLRKLEKVRYQNVASNIISNGTHKVEAKITPDAIFDKEMLNYKLAFDKEIIKRETVNVKESYEKYFLNTNTSERKYHFCIHFIRKKEIVKNNLNAGINLYRFYHLRNELKKQALQLNNFLYKEIKVVNKFDFYREFYEDKFLTLKHQKDLENYYIDLSKLITSIDIAGDENRTPPEVFAPVINYLRRDIKKVDEFNSNYIKYKQKGHDFVQNYCLRLSVHAGEDFNHIITGMRKIHETVKFYKMAEKDRLGHALALGLNPKEWCLNNGDIFVTKLEHLDNLIWIYHQSIEILPNYLNTDKLRAKYLRVIKELYSEIYLSENRKLSTEVEDMYKAWKLRESCPSTTFDLNNNIHSEFYKYCTIGNFEKEEYKKAIEIYKMYHICPNVRKKGDEVIKIEYENLNTNMYKYFITDEDLELIEAIQDRLIQKFCDKGIIIETNPSSNVYISYLSSFDKHPIFRWNPIEKKDLIKGSKFNKYGLRTSRMKVCVNTDDPAIMPTTLRNEFELLERSAFGIHSYNKEKIENWCEKIRTLGIEIFDYDHQNFEFKKVV